MPINRTDPAIEQRVRDLRDRGHTLSQIADQTGLHKSTVSVIVNRPPADEDDTGARQRRDLLTAIKLEQLTKLRIENEVKRANLIPHKQFVQHTRRVFELAIMEVIDDLKAIVMDSGISDKRASKIVSDYRQHCQTKIEQRMKDLAREAAAEAEQHADSN